MNAHSLPETPPLSERELNHANRRLPDPEQGGAHALPTADLDQNGLKWVEAKTSLYPYDTGWKGRRRRVLGGGGFRSHCYHVMSRTCGGAVHFDAVEKEALRKILLRLAEFSGVRVLTYCVMKNHFHVLAEVPEQNSWVGRFSGSEGEQRLMRHLRILYSKSYVDQLKSELADWRGRGFEKMADSKLASILRRFCDLPTFMKEVKERFSRWYNKRHKRKGTLWMDRFRSVLVEGKGDALRAVAAYIDLNPVRAGITSDPKEYRWCGYAEALAGDPMMRSGICRAMGEVEDGWERYSVRDRYRDLLFDGGVEVRDSKDKVIRKGVPRRLAEQVHRDGGRLSLRELVAHRVRYFSDGAALGGREFVQRVFEDFRGMFSPRRVVGPRRIPLVETPLFSLRTLGKGNEGNVA